MYTNIDTSHALEVIEKWLRNNVHQLPANFSLKVVMEAMRLVMTNNVLEFGDLFFLQLLGAAMGTSSAYM